MYRLTKSPKDFELYFFKDLEDLTLEECRENVQMLEYLVHKEVNFHIREKFMQYIGQLSSRLAELSTTRQAC
ncbi:MAG: hypothetical protein ACO1O1_13830 [Adhaeribacter sp.]